MRIVIWSSCSEKIIYSLAGRRKKAEELQVQVMETSKRVLGEEHPRSTGRFDGGILCDGSNIKEILKDIKHQTKILYFRPDSQSTTIRNDGVAAENVK